MAQAHHPPSNPTPQNEQDMDGNGYFRKLLRKDLNILFDLDPPVKSMVVRGVLQDLTTDDPIPQSKEDQVSALNDLSGSSLDDTEDPLAFFTEEETAESIGCESPPSLRTEPLSPVSDYSNEEGCLALMRVKRKIFPPSGTNPGYKDLAAIPGDVVYGLKVWIIDGAVYYRKRLKHETVVNDEDWKGMSLQFSEDFWKILLAERNDEQDWDAFGFWTPLTSAGEEFMDWDLYWFLEHRDVGPLWWVLMDSEQAPKGRFFLHFQTEFDEEE